MGNWATELEKEWLSERVGLMRFDRIWEEHQKSGFPRRSREALRRVVQRMGEHTRSVLDDFSVSFVMQTLGISYRLMHKMFEHGLTHSIVGGDRVISKRSLRSFAKKRPDFFNTCDREGLKWMLGEDIEKIIPQHYRKRVIRFPRHPKTIKIKNETTGKIYSSLRKAAIECNTSRNTIKKYLREGSCWSVVES